ncbi:S41 family peptidase [Thermogutta sp.]|uniref:S41 family peptidase n=1 Tax=Thermogutta sp. TaxID=1962930 RepID=UPI00321FC727
MEHSGSDSSVGTILGTLRDRHFRRLRRLLGRAGLFGAAIGFSLVLTGFALATSDGGELNNRPSSDPFSLSANEHEELKAVLEQGQALERQSRWGEALSLYEEAIRRFPGHTQLQIRFHETRLHYDLIRRYADSTFLETVRNLSERNALQLYDEVLFKIQAHYVESPHWNELYTQGVHGLALALSEPKFLAAYQISLSSEAAASAGRDLEFIVPPLRVQSRTTTLEAVNRLTQWLHEKVGLPVSAAVMEMICGAVNSLDPYSAFLTPAQLSDLYSQIEGNFVGLGVELRPQEDALIVLRVIAGSPAEKSGVRAGDRIVAVDGQKVRDVSPDRAAELLKGPEGTSVSLEIVDRDGRIRSVSVIRTRVEVPSVTDVRILDNRAKIGYFRLLSFQRTTAHDVETALNLLEAQGMRSLIIDLRGNPGGLLGAAVETADLFLTGGTIVSTQGRNSEENLVYTAQEVRKCAVPLVVLIDHESASAAEIFAGALQDQGRGTIVGTPSYGKGSIQGIFPLTISGAGLRLTTARFFSPRGQPYAGRGVIPDIRVQVAARPLAGRLPFDSGFTSGSDSSSISGDVSSQASLSTSRDPILEAGLQAAQQILAQRDGATR